MRRSAQASLLGDEALLAARLVVADVLALLTAPRQARLVKLDVRVVARRAELAARIAVAARVARWARATARLVCDSARGVTICTNGGRYCGASVLRTGVEGGPE